MTHLQKIYIHLAKKHFFWLTSFNYIVIFLCLVSFAYYIIHKHNRPLISKRRISLNNQLEQGLYNNWLRRIQAVGGKTAYSEFSSQVRKRQIREQHRNAHLFGDALYQVEGTRAISVCDTNFSYGCYHSFIGSAIYSEGLQIVPNLSTKCFEVLGSNDTGCQHGIGHGILASEGYDFKHLTQSLDICYKLKANSFPCMHGVFMEYNFQTMLLDEGKIRTPSTASLYYPCFDLIPEYQQACINEQAQWWLVAIQKPLNDKIKHIDQLCNDLPTQTLLYECYDGLGTKLIAVINYQENLAKNICNSLNNYEGRRICQASAARIYQLALH